MPVSRLARRRLVPVDEAEEEARKRSAQKSSSPKKARVDREDDDDGGATGTGEVVWGSNSLLQICPPRQRLRKQLRPSMSRLE